MLSESHRSEAMTDESNRGDSETDQWIKRICLWLKVCQIFTATGGPYGERTSGRQGGDGHRVAWPERTTAPDSPFPGIAEAMADQWGSL